MRALAQSLAREFGPKGIHVNHAIIDGVIDIERTKDWKFEHEDAKIKPEAVSRSDPLFGVFSADMCYCTMLTLASPDCRCLLVSAYSAENLFHERDRYSTVH